MLDRWSRVAPLAGLVFAVLVIVAGPVLLGSLPEDTASASTITGYMGAHAGQVIVGVYLLGLAFAAFLVFTAAMRARWAGHPAGLGAGSLMSGAAVLIAAGQLTWAGADFALTQLSGSAAAATAQTLNVIANDVNVTQAVGFLVYMGAAGAMALAAPGLLPRWLGWVALALAVLMIVPPIEGIAFYLLLVWVAVVGVLLTRRGVMPGAQPLPSAQPMRDAV